MNASTSSLQKMTTTVKKGRENEYASPQRGDLKIADDECRQKETFNA